MHLNVQCLSNKISLLETYCQKYKPNILCIDEHWLTNDKIICTYINDFSLITSFCRSKRKNGGTAIFVQNSIASGACPIQTIYKRALYGVYHRMFCY